ncbi:hypothetical protein HHK36_009431 [Tetracentron sinense]|uniref:Uncharacterized protein n=1 Tax=Tetracentron sinense TaxID=13715 RepID=A0A834ZAV9_TETSI|nr:hypothetical protein HHK36_009431 [Tetracentron sinense]
MDIQQHGETQSSFNFDTEEINWNALFPSASELLMQINPWISPYRSRRSEFRNLLNQVTGIPMDDHECDNTNPMNDTYNLLSGTSSLHPLPQIPPLSSQHPVTQISTPSVPVQEMFGYDAPLDVQQLPRGIFGYHADSLNWEEGVYPMFDPEELNWFPNSPLYHGHDLNVSEPLRAPRISSRSIYDPIYEDKSFHEDPFLRNYSYSNNNGTKDEDDTNPPTQGQKDLSSGSPAESLQANDLVAEDVMEDEMQWTSGN